MSKAEEIERLEELRRSGTLTDSLVTRRSESAGDPTSQKKRQERYFFLQSGLFAESYKQSYEVLKAYTCVGEIG